MNVLPKKLPHPPAYTERTIQAGFALALLCLGVIGIISFTSVTRLSEEAEAARHSEEFVAALRLLLSTTTDAETAQRGFAITGNESFLQPYNDARRLINADLENLRKLTVNNAGQQHQLAILVPVVAERINETTSTIELCRSQGIAAAQAAIASGQGKMLQDRIRANISGMEATEQALEKHGAFATQNAATTTRTVIIGGSALALVIVAFSLVFVRRDFAMRQRAETELKRMEDSLREANELLEQRVQDRTADLLKTSRDLKSKIVEHKWTEAALRESEELFSMAFRLSPDGVAIMRMSDRTVIRANEALFRLWGSTPEEVIGKPACEYSSWLNEDERVAFQHAVETMGECLDHETTRRLADGRLLDINVSSRMITLNGESCVLSVLRDITERKRTALALAESQALYHSLVEQMPAGVFRKDAAGRYAFVNSYFCRIRNKSPEQFLGKLPQELPPSEAPFVSQATLHHAQIMQNGQRIEVLEEHHQADGQTLFFHVVKSPVLDSDGKITGSQGVLFDVTTQQRAEDEVRRLNDELERRVVERTTQLEAANNELEAFSYSVSHDLRAPLRAVNGFAGIVLEEFGPQLNGEGRRYLERIRNGGRQMGMLIDDLLAFSRLGRQTMSSQTIDPAQVVQAALDELAPQRERAQIEINTGKLPVCRGDPALVKQVWVNLISNAIKYTRDRAPALIEIGCELIKDEKIYFVRDNGAGFDMQYAHKLFGVFQRLHRSDEFDGTGVGLAIVQRIVHRHGGRVWAEAKLNHGATFYFTLPE